MRPERGGPQGLSVGDCCEPGVCPLAGACVRGRKCLNKLIGWVGTAVR